MTTLSTHIEPTPAWSTEVSAPRVKVDLNTSLATGLRSIEATPKEYPLSPRTLHGDPAPGGEHYPLEVTYDYAQVELEMLRQAPLPGLARWQQLLPPLNPELSQGEGGTPLLSVGKGVTEYLGEAVEALYLKDETRNPSWSHKDRLNVCTVSAAVEAEAPGIVVASSGNHGASAAAYAARAGLPCVVLMSSNAPQSMRHLIKSYGAAVFDTHRDLRWPLLRQVTEELGYYPVSNVTPTHTGHPYSSEGYKTIAYELFSQLDFRVPKNIMVPTGYSELLYGVWKGFKELKMLGFTDELPRMYACEPEARAPLAKSVELGVPFSDVPAVPTEAASIGVTTNGFRGVVALNESGGRALTLSEGSMIEAREVLARSGHWVEVSSAASLAGLKQLVDEGADVAGEVVCITTSTGFKYLPEEDVELPVATESWEEFSTALQKQLASS